MNHTPRRRRLILLLILLCAAGLYIMYSTRSLISLRTAVAESLGFERADYKVYPTATNPQDFYGRVYARVRISEVKLQSASSADEASALVGLPVQVPASSGMGALDGFVINGAHAVQVSIDLEEARRILADSAVPDAPLPSDLELFQATVDIPPAVIVNQETGNRWYTLIQSLPVNVRDLDKGKSALLDAMLELNLLKLGLAPEEAQRFSGEFGWANFFVTPPTDLFHAELVSVNGSPALLLSQSPLDTALHAILWRADGIHYGLYGSLPPDELLQMAESLGGG